MNREQKRAYIKKLKANGLNDRQIDFAIKTKEMEEDSVILPEGTKVKLNLKNMQNHPDYSRLPKSIVIG